MWKSEKSIIRGLPRWRHPVCDVGQENGPTIPHGNDISTSPHAHNVVPHSDSPPLDPVPGTANWGKQTSLWAKVIDDGH